MIPITRLDGRHNGSAWFTYRITFAAQYFDRQSDPWQQRGETALAAMEYMTETYGMGVELSQCILYRNRHQLLPHWAFRFDKDYALTIYLQDEIEREVMERFLMFNVLQNG